MLYTITEVSELIGLSKASIYEKLKSKGGHINMLYTIAEVSELTGLSKTRIYKNLKLKELKAHISKRQGTTYITQQGFNLINESLTLNNEVKNKLKPKDIVKIANNEIAIDTESFNIKDDYIETLKEQLKEKDKHIEELTVVLNKVQELHKNAQILFKLDQEQQIKKIDDKWIRIKENMQERKSQYEGEEKKNWFNKLLRK